MKVEAVIFDIGNVLIEWQPERYYRTRFGAARQEAFFERFDFHELMNEIDAGAPFSETVSIAAEATPEFATELHVLRDEWLQLAGNVIGHSVRLLEALRARGVPVFVLSNFGSENFRWSAAEHPFLTGFDRSYISGDMGMRKPHDEIYAAVERDSGLPPGALLFADDRQDNIGAARARGWQGHLFEAPGGWAQALVSHGLLSEEDAR